MKKISVVISTKNRAAAITACLDAAARSFMASEHGAGEIVVVDNGSTDGTMEALKAWNNPSTIPLVIVYEPRIGLSAGRNRGIREASGDMLVFTDDDCMLSETYIREVAAYAEADGEALFMRSGSVFLGDPADLPITIKPVKERKRWKRPLSVDGEGRLLGDALIGCNVVAAKAVVDKVGFFDESLGAGTPCRAGEDTDFFYRAYLAGITLEIVPDLAVRHFHGRRTYAERSKLLTNYAIGNGALIAKYLFIYPNFSRHLYWDIKRCVMQSVLRPRAVSWSGITSWQRLGWELVGMWLYFKAAWTAWRARSASAPSTRP